MEFRAFPKIARLSRDMIVTEKIDGTNALIAIWKHEDVTTSHMGMTEVESDGQRYVLMAGSRNKWISTVDDNAGFAKWAKENALELSKLGVGFHYGEWWGQGIQRRYGLSEKRFSLFNVSRWSGDNVRPACCHVVPTLFVGQFDTDVVGGIVSKLAHVGSFAAPGFMRPEGVVVFHEAGGFLFKKAIEKDEVPKGANR